MSKSRANVNSFYHGPVEIGSGTTADYVVAHAERQARKGKQPSVTYRDIRNPQLAFEAARKDIEARIAGNFDDGVPYYTASYSGRVAILHASDDEQQHDFAAMFADARMVDGRCVGAIILSDFDEVLMTFKHKQINPDGTVDETYLYAP